MATGENCVEVLSMMPPGTTYAQLDVRAGGSSPAESIEVLDFDTTTTEYVDYLCRLAENYGSGGLTFTLAWMASSATSGNVCWEIAIRRLQDDAEDVDASHSYDYNASGAGSGVTAASDSGEVVYDTITFTDGVDMDSWTVGELAIVRVRRNTGDADDNMAGDAELLGIFGKET